MSKMKQQSTKLIALSETKLDELTSVINDLKAFIESGRGKWEIFSPSKAYILEIDEESGITIMLFPATDDHPEKIYLYFNEPAKENCFAILVAKGMPGFTLLKEFLDFIAANHEIHHPDLRGVKSRIQNAMQPA
jgi:hypothetical protein